MDEIEAWHELYVMLGGSAAVLIGLLFVAVSMHPAFFTMERFGHVRSAAVQALMGYVLVFIISICFLIPAQPRLWLGVELALIGIANIARLLKIASELPGADLSRGPTRLEWGLIFVSAGVSSLVLLAAGIGIAATDMTALIYVVPFVSLWLLINSIWISWELVLRVRDTSP